MALFNVCVKVWNGISNGITTHLPPSLARAFLTLLEHTAIPVCQSRVPTADEELAMPPDSHSTAPLDCTFFSAQEFLSLTRTHTTVTEITVLHYYLSVSSCLCVFDGLISSQEHLLQKQMTFPQNLISKQLQQGQGYILKWKSEDIIWNPL